MPAVVMKLLSFNTERQTARREGGKEGTEKVTRREGKKKHMTADRMRKSDCVYAFA